MRLVLVGQAAFAQRVLAGVVASGHEIAAVFAPPARGVAPEGLIATGDPIVNSPWTHAGVPAITVPAGQNAQGLPFGAQLIAPHGADEFLLTWAESIAEVLAGVGVVA